MTQIHSFSRHWQLDPDVTFLNHGSFGACPKAVLKVQSRLREQMEKEPVRFFVRELPDLLENARMALAAFVGARAENLVFVRNATAGVNAVLRSLTFQPNDELLLTNHAYNACANAVRYVARRSGAKVVTARIPFPMASAQQALQAVIDCLSANTRLVLMDHVTSPTGIIMPIAEIAAELRSRGVSLLVDGAHAPGMIPLQIETLGADYYAGNGHKWLCAPKGVGFLWAREDRQDQLHPTSISHGYCEPTKAVSRYRQEFDWTGTDDVTPMLALPEALRFMDSLFPGGWAELMAHNRKLCLEACSVLCKALNLDPPCPIEMIGTLCSLPLPDGQATEATSALYGDLLQDDLLRLYKIEVPIVTWPAPPMRLLRISAQVYNTIEQYQKLAAALQELQANQYNC